jgi:hypothetical protein
MEIAEGVAELGVGEGQDRGWAMAPFLAFQSAAVRMVG